MVQSFALFELEREGARQEIPGSRRSPPDRLKLRTGESSVSSGGIDRQGLKRGAATFPETGNRNRDKRKAPRDGSRPSGTGCRLSVTN